MDWYDKQRVALAACQEVINRGYGKPAQNVNVDQNITYDLSEMTDSELEAIAAMGR